MRSCHERGVALASSRGMGSKHNKVLRVMKKTVNPKHTKNDMTAKTAKQNKAPAKAKAKATAATAKAKAKAAKQNQADAKDKRDTKNQTGAKTQTAAGKTPTREAPTREGDVEDGAEVRDETYENNAVEDDPSGDESRTADEGDIAVKRDVEDDEDDASHAVEVKVADGEVKVAQSDSEPLLSAPRGAAGGPTQNAAMRPHRPDDRGVARGRNTAPRQQIICNNRDVARGKDARIQCALSTMNIMVVRIGM